MKKVLILIFLAVLSLLSIRPANAALPPCNLTTNPPTVAKNTPTFEINIPASGITAGGTTYELNFNACGKIPSAPVRDSSNPTSIVFFLTTINSACINKLQAKTHTVEFFKDGIPICQDPIVLHPATTDSCTITIKGKSDSASVSGLGNTIQVGEKVAPTIQIAVNSNDPATFANKYDQGCFVYLDTIINGDKLPSPISLVPLYSKPLSPLSQKNKNEPYNLYVECRNLNPKYSIKLCDASIVISKDDPENITVLSGGNVPLTNQCDKAQNTQGLDACRICDKDNKTWTALGCIPRDPWELVKWILEASINIAGGVALLLILFGGVKVITSSGNPEGLNEGKEMVVSAAAGLIFIVLSLVILKIVAGDILQIPGFI